MAKLECPLAKFDHPLTIFTCPVTKFDRPLAIFMCPMAKFDHPLTIFHCPLTKFPCPLAKFPCPLAKFDRPLAIFMYPVTKFECHDGLLGIPKKCVNDYRAASKRPICSNQTPAIDYSRIAVTYCLFIWHMDLKTCKV